VAAGQKVDLVIVAHITRPRRRCSTPTIGRLGQDADVSFDEARAMGYKFALAPGLLFTT
jgi:hypothetical protein